MKVKKSFATRLFVSMLAVLILPCFVLYIVYQQSVAKSVVEEVNTLIKNEQSTAMHLLDNSLQSFMKKRYFCNEVTAFSLICIVMVFLQITTVTSPVKRLRMNLAILVLSPRILMPPLSTFQVPVPCCPPV